MTQNGLPTDSSLVWVQPKGMHRQYELKSGEEVIGHLLFQKLCGSLASAEVASEAWTFKREGFLNPRVTVRAPNAEVNLAVFRPRWTGGGIVEFADGHQIHWRQTNFWGSAWSFVQNDDEVLISFKQGGVWKISAQVEIAPGKAASPEAWLLSALGWYLMLLAAQDTAVITTTTATVVATS